ncbi:MAG: hypothetical protein IKS90_00420 [Clostridia bacterium]|nr:hypothetical protein [Clostridia bacterium]
MARETSIKRETGAEIYYTRIASDGSLAYSVDPARRSARPAQKPAEEQHQKPERQRFSLPRFIRQSKFFPKLVAVLCFAAVAAVAFFAVRRFAYNAGIQSDINRINKQIEQTQDRIDELSAASRPGFNAASSAESLGLIPAKP